MSGTASGGKRAAITNKQKYGNDFYARIGGIGGKATGAKGFALNPELARSAGQKGGKKSKRGKAKVKEELKEKEKN